MTEQDAMERHPLLDAAEIVDGFHGYKDHTCAYPDEDCSCRLSEVVEELHRLGHKWVKDRQALEASQQALENRTSENERLRAQNQKLNERLEAMQSDADRDSQLIREMQSALDRED